MNPNKEVCRRFLVVFREGTESLKTVDEKLKHHADGLTSAVKLLKSAPDSVEIKNMWKGLISSTINMVLDLSDPPSQLGLQQFVEVVKPWLVTNEYKSYCHSILMDVYKMAEEGPWSNLPFHNLLSEEVTDPQQLMELFTEEPNFPAQRLRALYMGSKKDNFVIFGSAMLLHPIVKLNKEFEKLFQRSVNSFLQINEIKHIANNFNLLVTIEVLDELTEQGENAENLCTSVMEYLWENQSMDQLENLTTRWCQIISQKTSEEALYDEVRKCFDEGEEKIRSVQQCIILASTLWKVFPSKSRYVCVEILHQALALLKPDDVNHGQIESGILSSMIYFLPNSQVARYCTLTLFIRNPSAESYFEVAKSYRMKHKETTNDGEDQLKSLKVLDHLHTRWPPEFMLCTNWAWMRLRKLCLETMKSDDAAYVQQVEKEEAEKSLGEEIKVDNKPSQPSQTETQNSAVDSSCNTTGVSDSDASDVVRTDSSDPCDCLVCALKQANGQHIPHHHSGSCPLKSTPKPSPSKGDSPQPLSPLPGEPEGSWMCPEEACRRLFRSKAGITRHLNTKHMWMSSEIGAFYDSLGTKEKSLKTRTSRSDFLGKTATLSVDNVIAVDSALSVEQVPPEMDEDDLTNIPFDSLRENGEVTEPSAEPAGSSNFMQSSSKSSNPISLPPIFPKEKPPVTEAPDSVTKAQAKNCALPSQTPEIECPVESCTRTFRHRHTVQAHIEFRHKIKPGKAKKLAESAKFIPGPPSDLLRQNPPKIDASDVIGICKSRGWYMMVDDFLYDEAEDTLPGFQSLYRRQDGTLKSSLARDVICLFGNAPSAFDLAESQFNIEKNWQIQSIIPDLVTEQATEDHEPVSFEDDMLHDSFQFDHYDPDDMVEAEPPPVTRKLADISLMTMEVTLKTQEENPPETQTPPLQEEPTQEDRFKLDQGTAFTNVYCQTEISSADNHKFTEQDHYHVHAAGRVRPKKKQSVVACTVISTGYLGKPSRTLGLQCCQDKELADSRKGHKQLLASDKVKQKSSKTKEKTEASTASVPAKPKVKRRYDIQTLYQMAEKYKDLEPVPAVGNDAASRSFEDALNYSAPAVLLAEREKLISKARKKSSTSGSESKNRKESDVAKKAAPIPEKASKSKKTKAASSTSTTAPTLGKRSAWIHSEPADVAKRRKSDGAEEVGKRRTSEDEVKPSTNYQELLKQAEQLNARPKPMLQVRKQKLPATTPQPKSLPREDKVTNSNTKVTNSNTKAPNSNTKAPKAAPVAKRKSLPSLGTNRDTPESKMPAPMSTERPPGKPPSKKRRISLRSLSSMVERMEAAPSADSSQSLEDSFVASETDSLFSQGSHERSPSSVDTTLDSSDGQPLAEKVFCTKCNKQLKSAFALACHMRKRHKGQSKIFYPSQPVNDASDPTSNSSNGSKNSVEPPEENGAGNENTQVVHQVAPDLDSAPVFDSTSSSLEDLGSTASQESTFPENDAQPTRCSTPKLGDVDSRVCEKPFIEFEQKDGLFYCKVGDCTNKFKLRSSLLRHCKKKHPESYDPCSRRQSLHKGIGKTKRNAFKQAAYQIQAGAWHPSKRKGDIIIQELMILYNKRANKRIAMSLSPAPKPSRIEVPQESECQIEPANVISPSVSTDSVDSFKADFDANLPCWHCKEMFHCRRNLTTHIQHHLRLIDSYKFRCTYQGCLYAFSTKEDLMEHQPHHEHARCHLCLFCPNYSSVFRAAKQLLIHEHVAHNNIKVKLDKLRKQFCFKQFASISTPKSLPALEDNTEESPKDDSFLSMGHRSLKDTQAAQAAKTSGGEGDTGDCATSPGQTSVASTAPGEHRTVVNVPGDVLDDLLSAVSEYLTLPRFSESPEKQAVSWPKITAKTPCNVERPCLVNRSRSVDAAGKKLAKTDQTSGAKRHRIRRSKSVDQKVDKRDVSAVRSDVFKSDPAEIRPNADSSEIDAGQLTEQPQTYRPRSSSFAEEIVFDLEVSNSTSKKRKRTVSAGPLSAHREINHNRPYVVKWTNCQTETELEDDDTYRTFSPGSQTLPIGTSSPNRSPTEGFNRSKTPDKCMEVTDGPKNQATFTTATEYGSPNDVCDVISDSDDSVSTAFSVKTSTKGYFPCESAPLMESTSLEFESNIVASNFSREIKVVEDSSIKELQLNQEISVKCADLETEAPSLQQEVFLATENTDHPVTRIYDAVHDITAHIKDLSASECADIASLESLSTRDPTEDNFPTLELDMMGNDTDDGVFNDNQTYNSNIRDEDTFCVESAPGSPSYINANPDYTSPHTYSQSVEPEFSESELSKTPIHNQATADIASSDNFNGLSSPSSQVDVEKLVCGEVLHKLLCDVEIGEQVFFFRCCGMVPSSVLYYNCCDLPSNPASGVSVQGYKAEAFVAMELAQQALSYSYAQQQNAQADNLSAIEPTVQDCEGVAPPTPLEANDTDHGCPTETPLDATEMEPTPDVDLKNDEVIRPDTENSGVSNETVSASVTKHDGTTSYSELASQNKDFDSTGELNTQLSMDANSHVQQTQQDDQTCFSQPDEAVARSIEHNIISERASEQLLTTDKNCGEEVTIESESSNSDEIDVETYRDSPIVIENEDKMTETGPFIGHESPQQCTATAAEGAPELNLPLNRIEPGEIVVQQQDALLPESRHEVSPEDLSPSVAEYEEVAIAESLLNLGRHPVTEVSTDEVLSTSSKSPPTQQESNNETQASSPESIQNEIARLEDSVESSTIAHPQSQPENLHNQVAQFVDSVENNPDANPGVVQSYLQTGLPTDPNWSIENSHMASMAFAQSHPMWTIDANQTFSELSMADLSSMPIMQRILFCQYNVVTNPRFGVDNSNLSGFIAKYPVFSDEAQSLAFHAKPRVQESESHVQYNMETTAHTENTNDTSSLFGNPLLTETAPPQNASDQNQELCEEYASQANFDANMVDTHALNTTSSSESSASAVGELELSGSILESSANEIQASGQLTDQIPTDQMLQNNLDIEAHKEVNKEEQEITDNTLVEKSCDTEGDENVANETQNETEENSQEKLDPLTLNGNDEEHGDFFLKDFIEDFKKELRLPRNGKKFKQARSSLPSMFKVRNRPSVGFNKKYMNREMPQKMSMEQIVALHETLSESAAAIALDEKARLKEERKRLRAEKKRLKTEKREAKMLAKHRKLQLKMMAKEQERLQTSSFAPSELSAVTTPIIAASPLANADNNASIQVAEKELPAQIEDANLDYTLQEGRKRPRKQIYAKKRKSGVKRGSLVFFKSSAAATTKQHQHTGDLTNGASQTTREKQAESLDEKLKNIKLKNLTLVPMLNRLDLEYAQETVEPLAGEQNSSDPTLKAQISTEAALSKTHRDVNQRSSPITMTVPFAQTSSRKSYSIQFHNQPSAIQPSSETAQSNATPSQKPFVQIPTATVNPIASKKAPHKATLVVPSASELTDLYLCSMCNTKVKGMSAYITHLNVRHIFCIKAFACRKKHTAMCFRSYKTSEELEEHMKEHDLPNSFPCLLCRLWFASRTEVTTHLSKDHHTLYRMWLKNISDVGRRSQKPAQLTIKPASATVLPNPTPVSLSAKDQQYVPNLIDSYKQKYGIGDTKRQPRKSPPQKACKVSNIRVGTPPINFKPLKQTQVPKDTNPQQQQQYQFLANFGQSSQPSSLSQLLLKPSTNIQNQLSRVKNVATKNRFSVQNLNKATFRNSSLPHSSATAKQNMPTPSQHSHGKTSTAQAALLFPSISLQLLESLKKSSSVEERQPVQKVGTDLASPCNNSGLIIEPTPAMFNTYVHDSIAQGSNTITVPLQNLATPGRPVIGQVPVQSEPASVQNTWPSQRRPTISLDLGQNHAGKNSTSFGQEVAASSKTIDFLNTTKSFAIVAPTVRAVNTSANLQQNQKVFRSNQNTLHHQRQHSFSSSETSLYNNNHASSQASYSGVPTTQSGNTLNYYLPGQKLKQTSLGQLMQKHFGLCESLTSNQHQSTSNHNQLSKNQSSQVANYAGLTPTSCRGIFQITPQQRSRSLSLPSTTSTHLQHFAASPSLSAGSTQKRTSSSDFASGSAKMLKTNMPGHSIVSPHKRPAHQKSQEKKLFLNLEDNSETCLAECEFCNNIYSTFFDLLTHMKHEHGLSLCPIPKCGKTFATADDVCEHCSRDHTIFQSMTPHVQRRWIDRNIYFVESLAGMTSPPGKDLVTPRARSSVEDTTTKNHRIADEIWKQKTTQSLKDDHRQKLTTFFELIDGTEAILPSVFFEVKTYCERCIVHSDSDSEYHKCPLKQCVVFGSRRNLYYHVLQQHELEKILEWVRRRVKEINRKYRKKVKIVNPEPILIEDSDSNSRSPPKTNARKENSPRESSTGLDGSFISEPSIEKLISPQQQATLTLQPMFDSGLDSRLHHELLTTQRQPLPSDVTEQIDDVSWTIPLVDDVTGQQWQEIAALQPKNASPPKAVPTSSDENRYSDLIRISPPAGGISVVPLGPTEVLVPSKEYPMHHNVVASPVKPRLALEREVPRQLGSPKAAEHKSTTEIIRRQLAEIFGGKRSVQTPPTSAAPKRTSPNQAHTTKKARLASPKEQIRCESPILIPDEPEPESSPPKQDSLKNSNQSPSSSVHVENPPVSTPERCVQGIFDSILENLHSRKSPSQSGVNIVVDQAFQTGSSPNKSVQNLVVETPKTVPSASESQSTENGPKMDAERPEMPPKVISEAANATKVPKAAIVKPDAVSQRPGVYSFEPLVLLQPSDINSLPKKATFKRLPKSFKCRFHKCKRTIFGHQAMSEHMYGHVQLGKTGYHKQDGRYWPIFRSQVHLRRIDMTSYRRHARRYTEPETLPQTQQFCGTKAIPESSAKPTKVTTSEMIYRNLKLPCVLLKKVVTT